MKLIDCKSCNHHIFAQKTAVLCGYTIDRQERAIIKDKNDELIISTCPKEEEKQEAI
jgi:hypothetical protein